MVDEEVVEAVVTVHEPRSRAVREAREQTVPQFVGHREHAGAGRLELGAPSEYLATEVPVGPTQGSQADVHRVDAVDRDQGVDAPLDDPPRALGTEHPEFGGVPERHPVDPLHHQERGTDQLLVRDQREHLRHRHLRPVQSAQHPGLPVDVVRGAQDVAERRATQDPGVGPVRDLVGQVRAPPGQHPAGEHTGGLGDLAAPPRVQARQVQPGKGTLTTRHRRLAHRTSLDVSSRAAAGARGGVPARPSSVDRTPRAIDGRGHPRED